MKSEALTAKDLKIEPRKTTPIRKENEQRRIIISHLLYGTQKEKDKIDKAQMDPKVQPEVRELIGICKDYVLRLLGKNGGPTCNCAVPQGGEE